MRPVIPHFCTAALLLAGSLFLPSASQAGSAASVWPYQVSHAGTGEIVPARLVRLAAGDTPAAVTVSQKEKTFAPAEASVRVGQTVEIVNDDTTVHNAYCQSGDFKFNSGPQQPGSRAKLVFTAPGAYEVRCAIHPKMKLTVKVAE